MRDARRGVADSYGATGIPETFFVDARGRVVGHVIGVVSERELDGGRPRRARKAGSWAPSPAGARFDVR